MKPIRGAASAHDWLQGYHVAVCMTCQDSTIKCATEHMC
jgi:hypothetical protein